jgi:multimeric flavodoxin WrbA
MTEHGWPTDDWPAIYQRVLAADILVLAGPIWLGDNSSEMRKVIERLYACSHQLNGCLITGNEDGIKHQTLRDERPL